MSTSTEHGFPEIPGYTLESILGRGSMATVYRARQQGMNRAVAVKVLEETVLDNEKVLGRLMREARIAARFNHPHIVRALDAGVHGRSCYFVMELVEGRSIRELIETEGPFDERTTVELAIEIAEALCQLGREHIVHRDVKPANILVNVEGHALLADLGLAKIEFDSSMTSQNHAVGTPAYMSPEQARNPDHIDGRTDLFSLGATLYHMLTGVSPFDAPSVGAVITKILYHEPEPLCDLTPDISEGLEAVVHRLLEKERDARYRTPNELLRDLMALQRGRSPRLVPAKKPRRNRMVAAVSICLVAVIVFLWAVLSRDDTSGKEGEKSRGRTASKEPENPVPAEPSEQEVDLIVKRLLDRVRSAMRRGQLKDADRILKASSERDLAAALDRKLESLPRWVLIHWENETLKLKQELDKDLEASTSGLRDRALAHYRRLAAGAEEGLPLTTDASLVDRFSGSPAPENLPEPVLDAARLQVTNEVLGVWRRLIETQLETLEGSLNRGEFDGVQRGLDALAGVRFDQLGMSYSQRVERLKKRFDSETRELARQLANLLATADILPPQGSPGLRTRDFKALLSRFRTIHELMQRAGSWTDPQVETFKRVYAVVSAAQDWHTHALQQFAAGHGPSEFSTRDGRSLRDFKMQAIEGDSLLLDLTGAAEPLRLPVTRIAVRDLAAMQAAGQNDFGVQAWLSYCDADLAAVELALGKLSSEDPLVAFMASRLEAAWAEVVKVSTPAGKEAFRLWRQAMSAYRAGKWAKVVELTGLITASNEMKASPWYRSNRMDIRKVLAESSARSRLAGLTSSVRAPVKVTDLENGGIEIEWLFDDQAEAADFDAPAGYKVLNSALRRLRPASSSALKPTAVAPLLLELPVSAQRLPFNLEFTYQTATLEKDAPRFMVIQALGHNVALLSRLRARRMLHLPLHGVEKMVSEFVDFGTAAWWQGPMSGYASAFAANARETDFKFERNKRYQVRLSVDPKSRSLTFEVNGRQLIRKTVDPFHARSRSIRLIIPMPHALERLQLSCGLDLSVD